MVNKNIFEDAVSVLGGVDVINKGYFWSIETNKGKFEIVGYGNMFKIRSVDNDEYEYEFTAVDNKKFTEEVKGFFDYHKIKVKSIILGG